jgi:hypothetical protein
MQLGMPILQVLPVIGPFKVATEKKQTTWNRGISRMNWLWTV